MKIAVFVNKEGITIPISNDGIVKVYYKEDNNWIVVKQIDLKLNEEMDSISIRNEIKSMILLLEDCNIFVAENIKGISFTILEGMLFKIWKVKGRPEDFLDYISEKELHVKKETMKKVPTILPEPIESNEEGKFHIDLKAVLLEYKNLTTKKVLLPFLENKNFNELKVICGHVPPWFDDLNINYKSKPIAKGDYQVTIYKN